MAKEDYLVGSFVTCKGINGVVVYPRKSEYVTVAWNGFQDLDDYSVTWMDSNCDFLDSRKGSVKAVRRIKEEKTF